MKSSSTLAMTCGWEAPQSTAVRLSLRASKHPSLAGLTLQNSDVYRRNDTGMHTMYICIYVYIYIYTNILYIYAYTHTHTHIHTYIHTYIDTDIHTHTHHTTLERIILDIEVRTCVYTDKQVEPLPSALAPFALAPTDTTSRG